MTMERYHRCQHCRTVYLCLTSGERGYHTNHKNTRYCEECDLAIRNALATVPVKFEHIWRKTNEVTLKQLLEWEKLNNAEQAAKYPDMPSIRRVSSPLFRMEGSNITERQITEFVRGRDEFVGRHFNYRYWKGEEDEAEITEELELEVETGQTKPWRNL